MDIFKVIADSTRRDIINSLKDKPNLSTSLLTQKQNMSRQAVNKHLKILIEHHIVLKQNVGKSCTYALNPEPLKQIDEWLKPYAELWDQRLTHLQKFLGE